MKIAMVFLIKLFESLFFGLLRSQKVRRPYGNRYAGLSNEDKVKLIERRRQEKGYRPQWLYYRCKEEGLLKEYNELFKPNIEYRNNGSEWKGVTFTFGKYKGRLVSEI